MPCTSWYSGLVLQVRKFFEPTWYLVYVQRTAHTILAPRGQYIGHGNLLDSRVDAMPKYENERLYEVQFVFLFEENKLQFTINY